MSYTPIFNFFFAADYKRGVIVLGAKGRPEKNANRMESGGQKRMAHKRAKNKTNFDNGREKSERIEKLFSELYEVRCCRS